MASPPPIQDQNCYYCCISSTQVNVKNFRRKLCPKSITSYQFDITFYKLLRTKSVYDTPEPEDAAAVRSTVPVQKGLSINVLY